MIESVSTELEEQRCLIEQQQIEIQRQRRHIELQRQRIDHIQSELEALFTVVQPSAPGFTETPHRVPAMSSIDPT